MTQNAEVNIEVNDKRASEKLDGLEAKAASLRKQFSECFAKGDTKGIEQTTKELNKVNKEIRNIRTNAQNIQGVMKRLDQASPKELRQALKDINKELDSGRVPRGSAQWKAYCAQLKMVKAQLSEINDEMREDSSLLDKVVEKFDKWGGVVATAAAGFAGLVISAKGAVQAYVDMQQEEANTMKYTGMTEEEIAALNEEFKKMDTRTSREELNKLAQEAGRLGKSSVDDVLGFVRAADKINVSLDELGEDATLDLSKLTQIFGDEQRLGTEKALLSVGSVINELSQNCAASAPYLTEFASRLGGVGSQANMTVQQIMGIAAVLDSKGQAVEKSATAIQNIITHLFQDPAKYAKAAGISVKEFTDLLQKDANEALLTLAEALSAKGGLKETASIFADMGEKGSGAVATLSTLAENIGEIRKQQEAANVAFAEAVSIDNEFNVQNNTLQAGIDKAKEKFMEMARELGKDLMPAMRYCISSTSLLLRTLKVLVSFFLEYKGIIISTAAALVTYQVAINAATIAAKAHQGWIVLCTTAQKAWTAAKYLGAAAASLFTGNVNRATAAMVKFNAITKANPLGLLLSALTLVTGAIIAFATRTKQAVNHQQELANAEREAIANAKAEMAETNALYKKTQDLAASMDARLKAAEKLKEIHPDTFGNLSAEAIVAGQAAEAYQTLADNITKTAKAEAYRQKLSDNATALASAEEGRDALLGSIAGNTYVKHIAGGNGDANEKVKRLQEWVDELTNGTSHPLVNQYRPGGAATPLESTLNTVMQIINLQKSIDEYNAYADKIAEKISGIESSRSTASAGGMEADGGGTIPTDTDKDAFKKSLQALKDANDIAQAQNLASYSMGEIDYKKYLEKKDALDKDYLQKRMALYEAAGKADTSEYAALITEQANAALKVTETANKKTLEQIEKDHQEAADKFTAALFDPNSPDFQNQKVYNQKMLTEDLRYLNEKLALYQEGTTERANIEKEIDARIRKDQLDKQKETAQEYQKYLKNYAKLSAEDRNAAELQMLESLHAKKLITEKQYLDALKQLREKASEDEKSLREKERQKRYKEIEEEYQESKDVLANSTDIFAKSILDIQVEWKKLLDDLKNGENIWDNIGKIASNSLAMISAGLSQYTAYANAERDLELAKIEERYDREIEAAGKNTKLKEQLEEQKNKEINKTKKKYADKAMKVEIATALAQTAMNAILGYKAGLQFPFPANTFMPAVLAALAAAQGALQIATIKKQHQAEAAGYYEGGFTGGKNYRREAGVVHEGEFVANHKAVQNPEIYPLLQLLDAAQRNNTVGSLTADDVSIALAQGRGVSARGEATANTPTIITTTIDTSAIDRLNDVLDAGIYANVTIAGEDGFDKKYKQYQRMQNNPQR